MASLKVDVTTLSCEGGVLTVLFNEVEVAKFQTSDLQADESGRVTLSVAFSQNIAVQREFLEAPVEYDAVTIVLSSKEWDELLGNKLAEEAVKPASTSRKR